MDETAPCLRLPCWAGLAVRGAAACFHKTHRPPKEMKYISWALSTSSLPCSPALTTVPRADRTEEEEANTTASKQPDSPDPCPRADPWQRGGWVLVRQNTHFRSIFYAVLSVNSEMKTREYRLLHTVAEGERACFWTYADGQWKGGMKSVYVASFPSLLQNSLPRVKQTVACRRRELTSKAVLAPEGK